jgi:flotillin
LLLGNVGEQERKGQQDREIAKINAETAVAKTERDIERAQAEAKLETRRADFSREVEIARVEAKRTLESRDEDLKRDVEVKRAAAEMERMRAVDVVKATILRESKQQAADAMAYEVEADAKANFNKSQRQTDANAYKTKADAIAQAEADFTRTTRLAEADCNRTTQVADASAYKTKLEAEANSDAAVKRAEAKLITTLKEAEGMSAMADAYTKMAHAFGGPAGLLTYMMIEKGTYIELANANAAAVNGMQPKISVWNTGTSESSGGNNSSVDTMRNVYQMLPPLMTTINEQTGITFPEWQFGRMAATVDEINRIEQNGVETKESARR